MPSADSVVNSLAALVAASSAWACTSNAIHVMIPLSTHHPEIAPHNNQAALLHTKVCFDPLAPFLLASISHFPRTAGNNPMFRALHKKAYISPVSWS